MCDEPFEADFVVRLQCARQLFVAFGRAVSPECRRDRRNDHIRLARCQTIERRSSPLENVCVGAARVPRQRVKCRKNANVSRRKNGSEESQRFRDSSACLFDATRKNAGRRNSPAKKVVSKAFAAGCRPESCTTGSPE